jgi:hypothetical protein
MLKHGEILHFKSKGLKRLFAGFNNMRTGIYLQAFGIDLVAIYDNKELKLIQFKSFSNNYDYISSSPEKWVKNPAIEILERLGLKYKNEHVLFAEIIGVSDFDKVKQNGILEICIAKNWLN